MRRPLHSLAAGLLLLAAPLTAQGVAPADSSTVTLDLLFNSNFFAGTPVPPYRWTPDGTAYFSSERRPGSPGADLIRVDPVTGAKTTLVEARQLIPAGDSVPLRPAGFRFSDDGTKLLLFTNTARVWRYNTRGDYWVLDLATGRLTKLGGPGAKPQTLMFAKFAPQGDRVAYVREHNLYVERVSDNHVTALTTDGSRTTINGTFDWVYEEEFDDRDGFRWSPDGTKIAYWQLDASGVRDFLLLNTTDSLYSHVVPVQYPKAGATNSAVRVGVVNAAGGRTTWMKLPGADPRNIYLARMEWAANSTELVMQHLNRLQNTLTILLGSAGTGATRPVFVDQDSAWVNVVDTWDWLADGARFLWISERDGWRHAWSISRDGKDVRLLTPGAFDIADVLQVDVAGGWIYFTASPDNPTQRYLYRASLTSGAAPERLSPAGQPGTHRYQIAPGARFAIHTYSNFTTPPVTELVTLPGHGVVRVLADNAELKRRYGLLRKGRSEFVRVDAGNGVSLDGFVMYPVDFDSTKRYPVLFHVYGEPASQTATDSWGANDEWHLMLTQMGYAVVSFDNRGTPSLRGRAWRKSIYRQIGVLASEDQAGVARAMRQWRWVDSTRIGVWGWSGGGSMTLNLLFRAPDLFQVGMSVAPVPDVHLYDSIYQERYMGLPGGDGERYYVASSPLTYAAQLRGRLLLVHGTGDDNVHYQGSERLINALVAANAQFKLLSYPNRSHGIFEGENTTRHLFTALTQFLTTYLPAGGR